ncbi:hypothetical protein FF38_13529, partial [Lucilia cuprina]
RKQAQKTELVDDKPAQSPTPASGSKSTKKPRKVVKGNKANSKTVKLTAQPVSKDKKLIVFYSTLVGSTEKHANKVKDYLAPIMKLPIEVLDLNYIDDLDKFFVNLNDDLTGSTFIFVVPSYEIESPLDAVIEMLSNLVSDSTIVLPLRKIAGFSVFGTGDSESWGENNKFCYQAKQMDRLLAQLGGRRISPLGLGCVKTTLNAKLDEYLQLIKAEFESPSEDIEFDLEDFDVESSSELEDMCKKFRLPSKTLFSTDKWDKVDFEATRVLFLPSVDSQLKNYLLKNAALLAYTPTNEHFGIVPLEGMLYETPVLATNTGGCLETIVDNETGWLRSADITEWYEVLMKVLKMSKQELHEMGVKGRSRVCSNFNMDNLKSDLSRLSLKTIETERKAKDEAVRLTSIQRVWWMIMFSFILLLIAGLTACYIVVQLFEVTKKL